jgi:hypothetical protein
LQDLIQYHAKGYHLGIHPSWQSGDNPDLLKVSGFSCFILLLV